ncbi:MAG TPA: hypothetical protein VH008_25585 [Pseudonocardia sp.]|nr:hypothetical protein [Pseudonocardia sp.]
MATTGEAGSRVTPEMRAELSAEQVGHLRHFENLLAQQPNDWSLMQGKGMGQDDFGGYRFQLAYMTYALALTHAHRLPAAPGVFKPGPRWRDGGLYYPRNDQRVDADGHRTEMDPMSGNVLLAYARLNVADGFWKLYNQPWDRTHHVEPALTSVSDVDVTRAYYDPDGRELVFTVTARSDRGGSVLLGNLDRAGEGWALWHGDRVVARGRRGGEVSGSDGAEVRRVEDGVRLVCPPGGPLRFTLRFEGGVAE